MSLHNYWAMAARAGPSRLVARAPAQAHTRAASTSTSLASARRSAMAPTATGTILTSRGQSARCFTSSRAPSKQEEPAGPASPQSGPSEGSSASGRASDTSSDETSIGKSPTQTDQDPQPQQQSTPKRRSAQEEEDARVFQALHDRDGGGAGNEIVDGQFEKGMTKHTRANQYRVI